MKLTDDQREAVAKMVDSVAEAVRDGRVDFVSVQVLGSGDADHYRSGVATSLERLGLLATAMHSEHRHANPPMEIKAQSC